MSDISKCKGETEVGVCPLRDKCYRFLASADPKYQSYFIFIPYDFEKKECSEYWEK